MQYQLEGFYTIADGAKYITEQCWRPNLFSSSVMTCGQVFYKDEPFNVIVRQDVCSGPDTSGPDPK